MYYFDSEYLAQYLDLNKQVKVTVDGQVLTLADSSDVEDPSQGVGYEQNGDSTMFDYRDIESITVGSNTIDLATLQKIMGSEEPAPEKDKPSAKPDEPPAEEPAPDDEKQTEPNVQKSNYDIYMLGRDLIHEARKRKYAK